MHMTRTTQFLHGLLAAPALPARTAAAALPAADGGGKGRCFESKHVVIRLEAHAGSTRTTRWFDSNHTIAAVRTVLLLAAMAVVALPSQAQKRSLKRGVCWDEKTQLLTPATASLLAPGVSWVYTWGAMPRNSATTAMGPDASLAFVPMCWNGGFDEAALRAYLTAHPGVEYLLGFNEPNIAWTAGGSSMTPQQAADAWPRLEKIADDYGLKLVAPALNFSGDNVGGTVYSTPYDWLEAFLALYPTARMDYLCLHCYMDYATAVKWFATEYFYKDIYTAANQAKYPRLAAWLQANGERPLFLTEFCAMGNDFRSNGLTITPALQIDHMTQKLQYLEQSPRVAAYAWFMANGDATKTPYWSLMQSNTAASDLSEVGKVYVYMSAFDTTRYYGPGSVIAAKDYVDASVDAQQVLLRSNSEAGTAADLPLQVELLPSAWASYQVELPTAGEYALTLRCNATESHSLWVYVDGKKTATATLTATGAQWDDRTLTLTLPAGRHRLMVFNASATPMLVNRLTLDATTGIVNPPTHQPTDPPAHQQTIHALNGMRIERPARGISIERSVADDGTVQVRKILR